MRPSNRRLNTKYNHLALEKEMERVLGLPPGLRINFVGKTTSRQKFELLTEMHTGGLQINQRDEIEPSKPLPSLSTTQLMRNTAVRSSESTYPSQT